MTREEIIRLMVVLSPPDFADAEVDEKALDHFMPLFQAIAASAAAKEREACAKVCASMDWNGRSDESIFKGEAADECAAAIRARNNDA